MLLFRFFFCLNVVFLANWTFGQSFVKIAQYPIAYDALWTIDGMENLIIANNGNLKKYDEKGHLLFEQSVKQMGRCKKIGYINSLKLYVFSEEQQLLCLYDNGLAPLEKCIDLSKYGFAYVSLVEYAPQMGKFWIFDQINSALYQLSLDDDSRIQITKNLQGVLQITSFVQMVESENKLYALDTQKGVYVFDSYGTLIEQINMSSIQWMQIVHQQLFVLVNNELQIIRIKDRSLVSLTIQYENVRSFRLFNQHIYFATNTHVLKTRFDQWHSKE